MNILKYKKLYLLFSVAVLLPGLFFLITQGLKLSIDFTGGSLFKFQFFQAVSKDELKNFFNEKGIEVENITQEENDVLTIRTKPVNVDKNNELREEIANKYENATQLSFETVGPAIGAETTKNAFKALFWASLGILLYIAYAFRNIPKPYSSYRFGVSAIIAMLHDALLLLGVFSILGYFFQIEIDGLFITAVLTVIGFSVHDTIVVFDRIRENLQKMGNAQSFEAIVNFSVVETLGRSVATSLTVIIVLFALFILGGESIKIFVLAMLIGIVSGTYSSIFTASPILVIWENQMLQKVKSPKKK